MNTCSLRQYNTFGIDVQAANFLQYRSEAELADLFASGSVTAPWLHIGAGSNLLFMGDYPGTILHSLIDDIEVTAETPETVDLRVGAGVVWDNLVEHCVDQGWYGAENLSLIPGEVGAAAVQNIGAYGVEVKDLIVSVETMGADGTAHTYPVEACCYAYRDSLFKRPHMKREFVTRVNLRLSKREVYRLDYGTIRQELARHPRIDLPTVRRVIIGIRQAKLPDPKVQGNAGSFFKNPVIGRKQYEQLHDTYHDLPGYATADDRVKVPAAWLIERCGWKGKALGRAAVHDRQALVLVNLGGATGADILALAQAIRQSVRTQFDIEIEPEVNVISARKGEGPCD